MKKRSKFEDSLRSYCKRKLRPILSHYGPYKIEEHDTEVGFEILFKNATTGVLIECEIIGHELFMYVGELHEGQFRRTGGEFTPDTVVYDFSVGDAMALRMPPDELLDDDKWRSLTLEERLNCLASGLANCCGDILQGDFRVFEQLDKIVKERARRYAFEKWGDRAQEFGWKRE